MQIASLCGWDLSFFFPIFFSFPAAFEILESHFTFCFRQQALPQLTDRDKVGEIMDPALEGQYLMKEVIQVAAIAAMCVQPEADYRPLISDVVQSLVPLVKNHRSSNAGICQNSQVRQSPRA